MNFHTFLAIVAAVALTWAAAVAVLLLTSPY